MFAWTNRRVFQLNRQRLERKHDRFLETFASTFYVSSMNVDSKWRLVRHGLDKLVDVFKGMFTLF